METFHDDGVSSVAGSNPAGKPASKLLLGVGVTSGYYDSTEARVAAKVKYVEDHGLKGILFWQPGALPPNRTDPLASPPPADRRESGDRFPSIAGAAFRH